MRNCDHEADPGWRNREFGVCSGGGNAVSGVDMADNDNNGAGERPADDNASKPVIVAIGASAGGIEALQNFFGAVPDNTGAAFIVVVHIEPQHLSDLAGIIAARTAMPVVEVEAQEKLFANHVYVIPPGRRLLLTDHEILATEFEEPRGRRTAIDQCFRSVAERIGDGFAVILSGAGADGAIGVRAVKEAGGIILVQDPNEAQYGSMPRSAVVAGPADFVMPVRDLALRLAELMHTKQTVPVPALPNVDEEELRRILALLRVRTGHDFSKYKRSTMLRRVARRMRVARTEDLKAYYAVLRENADEARALLSDLLVSVTTFFRDAAAFDALAKTVVPEIFRGSAPGETIRIWAPGCATGEEAYSLAMLFLEEATRHEKRSSVQVFGSDLDSQALAAAREGRYPTAIEADVSEQRLRRFFTREGDHYRVRQDLRDTVLFAVHDLLKDPPFSRVDLISCRNVLIYLDRDLQEQVCSTFHYALNAGGFLFLGSAETADSPPGQFYCLDRTARIYQSTAAAGDKPRMPPRLFGAVGGPDHVPQGAQGLSPTVALSEAALHRRAIEQVAPPSMLVDENHRVVHLSENAGRFILPAGGPLSGDAVDLVRPELRFELRSALNRVFEEHLPTFTVPLLVRFDGAARRVHLLVKTVEGNGAESRSAVVMFIEGEAIEESAIPAERQANDETVRRLAQELELTQTRLRTLREEFDAANEELRAANEELQSVNEEYRATSEELESSKEELQSINEELQIVNSELKLKLDAISRAHSDLQNLMAATEIATLFLDSSLRIKRFTDRVAELFSITQADDGRPITDFAHQLDYDDLINDARTVLADLAPIRREIRSRDGRWYDVRLRPYRTVDDKIDGVVITFLEVSERHNTEQALRRNQEQLRQQKRLIDLSHDPIFIWDFDGGIVAWNCGCEELYGFSHDEALGQDKEKLLGTTLPGSSFADLRAKLQQEGSWAGELRHKTKDGRELTVESRLQLENFNDRRLVLESTRDVTARRAAERRQRLLLNELTHRVRNTLTVIQAVAHHSLRSSASKEDFVERFEGRLAALATAHTLLAGSDWKGADFGEIARQQLAPYVMDNPDRLRLRGETLSLPADLATPFGLVLHELATNAAKYGSLSVASGTVGISWTTDTTNKQRALKVVWQESGGPSVPLPTADGFGMTLISSVIPGARVDRDFRREGFACTIELTLPERADDGPDPQV